MYKNYLLLISFIFSFLLFKPALAQDSISNVSLEWEEITSAKKYDLEVKSATKTFKFEVKKPSWEGRLSPGLFKMRVRARDKRGVPGVWSEFQDFTVNLDPVQIQAPSQFNQPLKFLESLRDDSFSVTISWKKVFAAQKYKVYIKSLTHNFSKEVETTQLKLSESLPVAQKYQVLVRATNDVVSTRDEKDQPIEFIIKGLKVPEPELQKLPNQFVREIKWSGANYPQQYDITLEVQDSKTKEFKVVDEKKSYLSTAYPFSENLEGGNYRFSVNANAQYRDSSKKVQTRFFAKKGDRSQVAEELFFLRESIDRLSGWFATGSYIITSVNYNSQNFDKSSSLISYEAIGGTGKVGLGYMTKKNPWGFSGTFETSRLGVEGFGDISYKALELNGIYKIRNGDTGDFRQTFGVVYKELPELLTNFSGTEKSFFNVTALGLHYGVEYWHALNSKYGIQVNAHAFPMLLGQKTTNSQPLVPSLSYQAGFLASYRYSKNLTFLVGYANRLDQLKYKTSTDSIFVTNEAENTVQIQGNYLNLFMEYQL